MIKVTKRGVNIKNITFLFIVIFALCFIPNANNIFAQEPDGTLCGGAINWNLTDGVLTVEGSGEITNRYDDLPWYSSKASIKEIKFIGTSETENLALVICINILQIIRH